MRPRPCYEPYGLALTLGWWDLLYHHSRDPPPIVQTIFAWAFLLIIAFRFIPNTSRNRSAIGPSLVQQPISLFVLKSGTGFHTFKWLATSPPTSLPRASSALPSSLT
ncbi:hypothetical protein EDB84DRAFT_1490332 [Lactarius hengduanensis]|nr:hypothetical protein EDB84DRAFT_1490332 [Lactarius hengduanensis]